MFSGSGAVWFRLFMLLMWSLLDRGALWSSVAQALVYMREEEKLAHDVYVALHEP